MSCAVGDAKKLEGDKALSRSTLFGFGKIAKYQDAAECYKTAANAYKLADHFRESAECYLKASECCGIADENPNSTDAVNMLIEAANCFKRDDISKSIQTFAKVIQIYSDSARLSQAARYQKEVAEMLEADNNLDLALIAYEKAVDLYEKDNKKSNAKDCKIKVATILSTTACSLSAERLTNAASASKSINYFQKATVLYESVAKECLESKLGSYSAKGHFFYSLLCTLALG